MSLKITSSFVRSFTSTVDGGFRNVIPASAPPSRRQRRPSTRFKYGSLVTAVCTHQYPPPSCHHIKLREGGTFYTDCGQLSHRAIADLRPGSVVRIGREPVSCHVLFHETRREDHLDKVIGFRAKQSRRFVHPHDLANLCSIVGVEVLPTLCQSGFRVMEVGVDFGHLTLLLADLVGTSGHVFSTSTNSVRPLVKELICDWLISRGDLDASEKRSNVTLHAFDGSNGLEARRHILSTLTLDPTTDHFDFSRSNADFSACNVDDDADVLDAVFAVKLPEEAMKGVVEAAASLLGCGGSIGVIPVEFSHLRSLVDHVHRRRLPFFLEIVRQPEVHRCLASLTAAEAASASGGEDTMAIENDESEGWRSISLSRPSGVTDGGTEVGIEDVEDETLRVWPKVSQMGFPKDLKYANYWPGARLSWSRRRYQDAWVAKFVKVSDFDFVSGAEMAVDETVRVAQMKAGRQELIREIREIFPWDDDMETRKAEMRSKLLREVLDRETGGG